MVEIRNMIEWCLRYHVIVYHIMDKAPLRSPGQSNKSLLNENLIYITQHQSEYGRPIAAPRPAAASVVDKDPGLA